MNAHRKAGLSTTLVFVALFASAAVKNGAIRITVVDSETRSFSTDDNGVPRNCDQVNYDAYCHSGKTAEVINTLLVQEGNSPAFRVSCTIDSKWSRCIPLPKGESFDARKEKRGLTIYYVDDQGNVRKQLYTYVTENQKIGSVQPAAGRESEPSPSPTARAGQASTATAEANSSQATVKCSFTSTPSGAEVTVDGRYVGSTPSVVNLNTGTRVVVVSLPGFALWKRELSVAPGSELTVNAVLEKVQ